MDLLYSRYTKERATKQADGLLELLDDPERQSFDMKFVTKDGSERPIILRRENIDILYKALLAFIKDDEPEQES